MEQSEILQNVLNEIFEITRIPMLLYDAAGLLTAHTTTPPNELSGNVLQFIASDIQTQTLGYFHYFKAFRNEELSFVLLAGSLAPDSSTIGRLAVCQLKNLLDAYHEEVTRSGFLRNFLLDALSPTETDSQLGMLSLPSSDWCLFVIECDESFTGTYAYQTVENGFASGQNDLCCELDAQHLVLVKDAGSLDIPLFSRTLVDTLRSEAMIQTHVGYSSPVADFKQLASSYQEARIALSIRRTFYAEQDTASYNQLGLGRLIAELPAEPCRIYLKEMFADFVPDELTEEERNTIQIFYENNLNISETARQLYLHRNTLVYRLERLEKKLGLDIRKFEDAMNFKIAFMISEHLQNISSK